MTTTFAATWDAAVAGHRDRTFLRFAPPEGEAQDWTYGEFDDVVARCAGLLASRGVRGGDAVHLVLANCSMFVAVWLGASRIGAWIVPSDPMSSAPELAEHLQRTRPVVAFVAGDRAATYRAALAHGDGDADAEPTVDVVEVSERDVVMELFHDCVPQVADAGAPAPLARAAVMFTSGTTGRPKGVEITQANYAFAGATMAAAAAMRPEHRVLVVLPLFHANAQFYSFAAAISVGASVALMPAFSASGFLSQVVEHGATHASLFAAPMRMILARSAAPCGPVGLQHCWYAMNITDDQHAQLSEWFGCRPRQLYGMTETLPAVLSQPSGETEAGSMGVATPGCLVDIVDGEVFVGGRRGVELFAGYLDDAATTAASFRGHRGAVWFVTGDRAHHDGRGRFVFDGRGSDVLKVAGENVSTVEVEQVLSAHPGVLEAAVIGLPDEIRDEVPVAFVVASDAAHPPSIEHLTAWCEERLTKSKRPRDITLVDQLPRTSVGKIRKFMLHDATRPAASRSTTCSGGTT